MTSTLFTGCLPLTINCQFVWLSIFNNQSNFFRVFEPLELADSDKILASDKGFYALILDNLISELCKFECCRLNLNTFYLALSNIRFSPLFSSLSFENIKCLTSLQLLSILFQRESIPVSRCHVHW